MSRVVKWPKPVQTPAGRPTPHPDSRAKALLVDAWYDGWSAGERDTYNVAWRSGCGWGLLFGVFTGLIGGVAIGAVLQMVGG